MLHAAGTVLEGLQRRGPRIVRDRLLKAELVLWDRGLREGDAPERARQVRHALNGPRGGGDYFSRNRCHCHSSGNAQEAGLDAHDDTLVHEDNE